ncbi:Methylated-DNA--protein-cysteine methyltransferase [Planctomycetales bacterium 10988]|nr:Methylated-DNA--protein-cysteine methyltransferase [Planctomycetales bacterium 10988]
MFPTELGWFGFSGHPKGIDRVVIGYASLEAAWSAIENCTLDRTLIEEDWAPMWRVRLQKFAQGEPQTFLDLPIAMEKVPPFRRKILDLCRQIPYGQRTTYGKLATLAGSPKAARAVGGAMANNRWPVIIPCHRVVGQGKTSGGFTAPGGLSFKKRLLELEQLALLPQEA